MFGEAPSERISQVYLAESAEKEVYARYEEKLSGLPCEIVSDEVFGKMSDTVNPQGILCLVRQFSYSIEDMLSGKEKKQLLFIILEDIHIAVFVKHRSVVATTLRCLGGCALFARLLIVG